MSKRNLTFKWIVIALLSSVLIAAAYGYYILFMDNIAEVLIVEAGSTVSAADFKIRTIPTPVQFTESTVVPDTSVPGEYPVELSYCNRTYSATVRVEDTRRPVVTTKDVVLFSSQTPVPEDFIAEVQDYTAVTVQFAKDPDPSVEGSQSVILEITDMGNNVTKAEANLSLIFDRTAPVIEGPERYRAYVGVPVDLSSLVTFADDLDPSPVLVVDDSGVNQSEAGLYSVTYTATDICGNITQKTVELEVVLDSEGPEILGVIPKSLYQGGTISYRNGMLVRDNYDEAPVLQIDSSKVDLSTPGIYEVTYAATDAAGNTTTLTTTVTVQERTAGYVEESVIYAKADELLATIVDDTMTPKEQVTAVYNWVTSRCRYRGGTDKTDKLQAAYVMMTTRVGDCYNYYAICSLFFDRLGFPNLEVKRSENSVRGLRHWWNMVSIDGGESYYHVDTCPNEDITIRICLATDARIQRCHVDAPGYYTYDKDIYPSTPKEAP